MEKRAYKEKSILASGFRSWLPPLDLLVLWWDGASRASWLREAMMERSRSHLPQSGSREGTETRNEYALPQLHLPSTDPVYRHLIHGALLSFMICPLSWLMLCLGLRTATCLWTCGIENLATMGDCLLHFTQRNTSLNEAPEDELSDGVRALPATNTASCLPKLLLSL